MAKQKVKTVLLGIIFGAVLLEIGLRLGGSMFSFMQERRNKASLKKEGVYRIMCLGESTTAVGGSSSWPAQLGDILNARGSGMKFSVINKGVPSIDTFYILKHLEENIDKYNPDMVITMMGMNDTDGTAIYKYIPVKIFKLFQLLRRNISEKAAEAKFKRLETVLREKIKGNPNDANSYMNLERLYQNERKFAAAEAVLKKSIELNPGFEMAYFELERCYEETGKDEEAVEILKRAVELNPKNDMAYSELGRCYKTQGNYAGAESAFKKITEFHPKNDYAYFELGRCYKEQGKYDQAESILKKVIELNPQNDNAYFELGRCYREQGEYEQARKVLRKTGLKASNDTEYFTSGNRYKQNEKKYEDSERALKKAIEMNPKDPRNDRSYFELGRYYIDRGEYSKAEETLKKALETYSGNDKVYGELGVLYEHMNKFELSKEYYKKAESAKFLKFVSVTRSNYIELKKLLDKRGIKLVCVQYPMRSVKLLKCKLKSYNDIVFVDNEKLFKDALKNGSYDEYFRDACYADFGHGTPKGNRLLAQNIADVLMKECFKDKKLP